MNLGKNIMTIQAHLYVGKKRLKFIMATTGSFTSCYKNRLCNKVAQDAIITRRVENSTAFARQHMYQWVNKRGRLLARVHKAVNSTVVLSAVASLNEDRLIALEAQIKLFEHIMRSNENLAGNETARYVQKYFIFIIPLPCTRLCSSGKAQYAQPLHYYFKSAEQENGDQHPPYRQASSFGTELDTPANQA